MRASILISFLVMFSCSSSNTKPILTENEEVFINSAIDYLFHKELKIENPKYTACPIFASINLRQFDKQFVDKYAFLSERLSLLDESYLRKECPDFSNVAQGEEDCYIYISSFDEEYIMLTVRDKNGINDHVMNESGWNYTYFLQKTAEGFTVLGKNEVHIF